MRIFAVRTLLILTLGVGSAALAASGPPPPPVGLLVNGVHNPLAIDRNTTQFTWMCVDTNRGETQSAYQILVASSAAALAAGKADWWNSGKVDSENSAAVVYGGKALPPATRFCWEVRVWDQTGKASSYSAPAYFDTGLSGWRAQYIWDGTTNVNNFAYFRKTFTVTHKPNLAKVYVTAHNDYLLYFDGHLLGRGPARCNPYRYGQYNAYDITKLVNIGTNVFAAMGHWQGNWHNSGINAKPAFRLEARFNHPDGSITTIGTDASWKALAHTPFIETNAMYFGGAGGAMNRAAIRYDSLLEPVGWQTVDFNDSGWTFATVVDRSNFHLFPQMAPLEREQAALKPVSITHTNGAWLMNFGWCLDGWPKLTMHANRPGSVVRVNYYEMTGERKPAGWDEYICRGGTETWDADFGRHTSFQELEITGYAGTLRTSDVRGMWAFCDADVAGRFDCSSPLVNAVYQMCVRSAQQNVQQGIISVDAQREQTQWLADSWNIGNVLLYNDRDTTMIDKVIRDYAGEQFPDGYIPAVSPGDRVPDANPSGRIPEWAMYWPMLLWQQYLFSGNETLLHELAPRLTRFLDWVKPFQDPTTKLLNPPGWRISEYAGGNMPSGGYNIATACEYYRDLRIASRVFSVLGQTQRSDEYSRQAKAVKAGINAHLFNGQYYLARPDRKEMFPLASAWALRFNIEPAADKSEILAVIEKAGKPYIGGYGGDAFYSGLLNAGDGAFVVRDMARYRPMLDSDKANWESFYLGRNIEVNHAWTSYPGYLFQKYILGIQPTSGGFATFDVRPDASGLTFAEGAVPTVKGLITTRWKKGGDGRFTLSVHVPANTHATIYIPKLVKGNVTLAESGKVLWPAKSPVQDPGVLADTQEDSSIKCLVGGGDYQFHETPLNHHH